MKHWLYWKKGGNKWLRKKQAKRKRNLLAVAAANNKMSRRRVIKIPKTARIKCPHCSKVNSIKIPEECVYFLDCKKCKKKIETPLAQCCVICAYSTTQCLPSAKREAFSKNLTIRRA